MKIGILIIGLWALMSLQFPGDLNIIVSNIRPAKGELYIAVYDHAEQYMDPEAAIYRKIIAAENEMVSVVFEKVPEGRYAVAIFHDLNGNGKPDMKKSGIPGEPFGFSNNARSKTGPPDFEKASFNFSGAMEINIKLINNAK